MSIQCKSKTATGAQCKKRTLKTNHCYIHLGKEHNLRVKKSNIPNAENGLFIAKQPVEKNYVLSEYTGPTSIEHPEGDYVLQLKNDLFIDGFPKSNIARYSNTCKTKDIKNKVCRGNNARFTSNVTKTKGFLKTNKKLKPGEEVFVTYGREYKIA